MDALASIDRTALLAMRPARAAEHAAENQALQRLGHELANPGGDVLAALAQEALELCRADSAGISVLEPGVPQPVFRWHAIRGRWAQYQGQGLPRNGSPCGVTIGRNQTCLMTHPERVYPGVAAAEPAIEEVLLAPFSILEQPLGTVWVIFHAEPRARGAFDREDARLVQSLARFASNAFLVQQQARSAVEARDEIYRSNRRLMKILKSVGGEFEDSTC